MATRTWPALDGVRAVAVLLVVAYHLELPYSERGGTIGVTMFFALSGFLITSLLLREGDERGSIHLPSFFVRRALRLIPALVVLCAVATVWALVSEVDGRTLAAVPWVLGYVGNWERVVHGFGSLGAFEHAWSLGIEEQFYAVWPLCLVALSALVKRPWRAHAVLVLSLAGAVTSLVWRLHLWNDADPVQSAARLYNGTDAVADQLLLGAALAALLHLQRAAGRRALGRACAVLALPALAFLLWIAAVRPGGSSASNTELYVTYGSLAFALAATVVVAAAVLVPGAPLSRFLASAPLRAIGVRSYGVYLWHYAIWFAVAAELPSVGINARRTLVVAGTVAATVLSYRYVELPALRRKRRFERVAPARERGPQAPLLATPG